MKTIQKVLLILMVIACVFTVLPQNVFANNDVSNAKAALSINTTTTADVSGLQGLIGNLVGFLQIASGLAAVFMIAFTGFNYIVGTPELKNEMKAKMLPIIVGLILVFGAVSIAKFILGAVGGGA